MDDEEVVRRTRRGEWVGGQWRAVSRGVRRHAAAPDPFRAALLAWLAVLPEGSAFTHLTSARLRGWWLPPLPDDLPVFVVLPPGAHRVRRPGLVAIRRSCDLRTTVVDGLPLEEPGPTLAALARDLEVLDLTCLVDAARRAGASLADLTAYAAHGRGAGRLRVALSWSDPRAESIWEVLLRELHRACGIEVVPQHEVREVDGGFVARGDLWLVGTRALHEYDGGDHLDRTRQRKDRKRDIRLGHADWVRRGYTADDVLHQGVTILRDADAALGREHDPARIRAWHDLVRQSSFSPAGTRALRARLGLPTSGHEEGSPGDRNLSA